MTAGAVVVVSSVASIALAATTIIVRRFLTISRLASRIEADTLEPRSTYPTIAVAPARHLRTGLPKAAIHLDWIGPAPGVRGALGITEREIVLDDDDRTLLCVPLSRVADAAFIREHDGLLAGETRSILRVVWMRGGQQLSTTFAIEASWVNAEKLRKEIHFRVVSRRPPT